MPSERDLRILEALREARQQHPTLVDLISLYYDLCQVQFRTKADLPEPEIPGAVVMRGRLAEGVPQLTFDQLGVEPQQFSCLVQEIADLLVLHNHPASRAQDRPWTPDDLVARAREIVKDWDTLIVPRPVGNGSDAFVAGGLTVQAVGFALAPYLQRAAERILPELDLAHWIPGFCPVCGGRPNLALLAGSSGTWQLVCSRCAAVWDHAGEACPFCESETLLFYLVSRDRRHHLYVCPGCNGYLKAVDLSRAQGEVYPLVEYLLTVGMDLAARQEGYGR